jgi:hypothetical protein
MRQVNPLRPWSDQARTAAQYLTTRVSSVALNRPEGDQPGNPCTDARVSEPSIISVVCHLAGLPFDDHGLHMSHHLGSAVMVGPRLCRWVLAWQAEQAWISARIRRVGAPHSRQGRPRSTPAIPKPGAPQHGQRRAIRTARARARRLMEAMRVGFRWARMSVSMDALPDVSNTARSAASTAPRPVSPFRMARSLRRPPRTMTA